MATKELLLEMVKRITGTLNQIADTSKFPLTISGTTITYNDVVRALLNTELEFNVHPVNGKVPFYFYPSDILYEAQNYVFTALEAFSKKNYEEVPLIHQWNWVTAVESDTPRNFRDVFQGLMEKNDPEQFFLFDKQSLLSLKGMRDEIATISPIILLTDSQKELGVLETILNNLEYKINRAEKCFDLLRYIGAIYVARANYSDKNLREFDDGRFDSVLASLVSLSEGSPSMESIGDIFDNFRDFMTDTKSFFIGASKNVQNLLQTKKWKNYNSNIIYGLYDKYGSEVTISENDPTEDPVLVMKQLLPSYLESVRNDLGVIAKKVIAPLEALPTNSEDAAIEKAFAEFLGGEKEENSDKMIEKIVKGMRREFAKALFTSNGENIAPYGFSVEGYTESGKLPKANYLMARVFVKDPEDQPKDRPVSEVIKSADSFEILRRHGHEFVIKEMQEGIRFTEDTLRYGDLGKLRKEFKENTKEIDEKQDKKDVQKLRKVADRLVKELDFMKKYVIELHKLVPTFHGRIINLLGGCYAALIDKEARESSVGGSRDRRAVKLDNDKGLGLKLGKDGLQIGRKFAGSKTVV